MLYPVTVDIDRPVGEWHSMLMSVAVSDMILLPEHNKTNIHNLIWFLTNYTQHLVREGGSEVAVLYGRSIYGYNSFIDQINYLLPVGYRLAKRPRIRGHALYDLLLNFETEPPRRFVIWNEADVLLRRNRLHFDEIFESMVGAAYCNRLGLATLKDDGTPYQVDQRNIFVFHNTTADDIREIVEKKYWIGALEKDEYKQLDFTLVELIGSEDDDFRA